MKRLIVFFGCIGFFISNVTAQEIQWQKTIGGNSGDQLYSACPTKDGGFICGGSSSSSIGGDKTDSCRGSIDYWVVKLDSSGNIQWDKTIGGTYTDDINDIKQTMDGGFILGGLSNSFISGEKTENCLGDMDYWVVKLDSTGDIQWQNTVGGNYKDEIRSVNPTSDGGYICGGSSESHASGDKTENSLGGWDFWVIKLDSTGYIQWQNTIGGNLNDYLNSIFQTADGGYMCGGYSNSDSSSDKMENCLGLNDYWVVKLDSIGNIQWQNTIGGNGIDYLWDISPTFDKGFICAGGSYSNISGDKTENSLGGEDCWVVKLDSIGNIQWQKTIGGNAMDWIYSILQTKDGGYLIGGNSVSDISGDKMENSLGGEDWWVIKLDSIGNIQWQNSIGGNDNDELYSVFHTTDFGYICSGWSLSGISGDKTSNSQGPDFWVLKLTDKFNSIAGKLFLDINLNNVQDIGEPPVQAKKVTEANTNRFTFSQPNGDYQVSVLDTGNYTVSPVSLSYYQAVPVSNNAAFTGINQADSLNDFAFQPTGAFDDLCVTVSPLGNLRAGFDASYVISYENVGTTTISNPYVVFFIDTNFTYVSSFPVANNVTADSVVWFPGSISPYQTGSITVTINVKIGTVIGTLINSQVFIGPVVNDANPSCNYASWEEYTTGSFDPNEIHVDRDTILTTELVSPPFLNYVVFFQNTGNDTAFNIKVVTGFDPAKYNTGSFEFVASSHPVKLKYVSWERNYEFIFDNILLPDSNVNEPGSHGFVRFRIKPKSNLLSGSQLNKSANIYFDFNDPVRTNIVSTYIVGLTGTSTLLSEDDPEAMIYPNPVSDKLVIRLSNNQSISEVKIVDLLGRDISHLTFSRVSGNQSSINMDVSGYSAGLYFLEIKTGKSILFNKFVKE